MTTLNRMISSIESIYQEKDEEAGHSTAKSRQPCNQDRKYGEEIYRNRRISIKDFQAKTIDTQGSLQLKYWQKIKTEDRKQPH